MSNSVSSGLVIQQLSIVDEIFNRMTYFIALTEGDFTGEFLEPLAPPRDLLDHYADRDNDIRGWLNQKMLVVFAELSAGESEKAATLWLSMIAEWERQEQPDFPFGIVGAQFSEKLLGLHQESDIFGRTPLFYKSMLSKFVVAHEEGLKTLGHVKSPTSPLTLGTNVLGGVGKTLLPLFRSKMRWLVSVGVYALIMLMSFVLWNSLLINQKLFLQQESVDIRLERLLSELEVKMTPEASVENRPRFQAMRQQDIRRLELALSLESENSILRVATNSQYRSMYSELYMVGSYQKTVIEVRTVVVGKQVFGTLSFDNPNLPYREATIRGKVETYGVLLRHEGDTELSLLSLALSSLSTSDPIEDSSRCRYDLVFHENLLLGQNRSVFGTLIPNGLGSAAKKLRCSEKVIRFSLKNL